MAGVTDAMCLDNAGLLTERRVLVARAAGGVGRFACQRAALSGAEVCAISRRPDLAGLLERDGVVRAAVFRGMAEAARVGSYDVILDSVGGGTQVGRAVRRSRMRTGMA